MVPRGRTVRIRLEGIGFGFLIPIYFVVTGMTFDLDSLLSMTGIGLAALFLGLLVVVRGASALLWVRRLPRRETLGLALFGATGLPLIVAIVGIGTERGAITAQVGASLIGAGMLSVLIFPLVAIRVVGRRVASGAPVGDEEYPTRPAPGRDSHPAHRPFSLPGVTGMLAAARRRVGR